MSQFLVAYSTLVALKRNVKNHGFGVEEKYIDEYDRALRMIEDTVGKNMFDRSNFEIPKSEIAPYTSLTNYVTGETHTSDERYCDEELFRTKLDSALTYLQMISTDEDKQRIMGFHASEGED